MHNSPNTSKTLQEDFVLAVRSYITFVDTQAADSKLDHGMLFHHLAELQVAGLRFFKNSHAIPANEIENEDHEDTEALARHQQRYNEVSKQLGGLAFNYYHDISDPHAIYEPAEVGMGSLTDDLADIYLELADGLRRFESGNTDDAVWHWRFSYMAHWGTHLCSAMLALRRWNESRWRVAEAG